MAKKNSVRTSTSVAKTAAKLLKNSNSKNVKRVAGSALVNTKKTNKK